MTPDDNNVRQKFLLGLTLSEISFIYFIIILLISLSYIKDYQKGKEDRVAEVNELIKKNDSLQGALDITITEIEKLENRLGLSKNQKERDFLDREMDRRKFEEKMKNLRIAKEKYDEILEKQEDLKLDKDNMTPIGILEKFSDIKEELEQFGTDNDSVEGKISDLVAKSEKYESNKEELKEENEELKEELEELEKDLELAKKESTDKKGEGDRHGPPPCFFTISEKVRWKDKKKEDYMYNVSINVNNFDLKPVWKTKDSESMKTIWKRLEKEKDIYKKSFALSRNSFRLNKDQFARLGAIIDKHAEENECKHYVRIIDKITNNPKTTIEDIKKLAPNRLFVERYFYKYEVPLKKTK